MDPVLSVGKRSDGLWGDWEYQLERLTYTGTCAHTQQLSPTTGSARQLSWPKIGDKRRAVVAKSKPERPKPQEKDKLAQSVTHIVPFSQADIERSLQLSGTSEAKLRVPLDIPLPFNPSRLELEEKELLVYFQQVASRCLSTFGHESTELGDSLIRVALASNTTSAVAVLHALLAFSSLHRHGVQAQAVQLKISALRALASASSGFVNTKEAIQHVAAGMLLCSFETHQASCTSNQWLWYIDGVKHMIQVAHLNEQQQDSDLSSLLDWVYYHDVLARFTLRHWKQDANSATPTSSTLRAKTSHRSPPSLKTIALLSDICDALPSRIDLCPSTDEAADRYGYLKILDWRIRNTSTEARDEKTLSPLMLELFHLAMLLYIARASANILNQAAKTQQYVERGFEILSQLKSCEKQFPVFVFGCDARTDHQRGIILELISRTENVYSSRSFHFVKVLTQAMWAQDDLANHDINYWDKLSYMISTCAIMPTFI